MENWQQLHDNRRPKTTSPSNVWIGARFRVLASPLMCLFILVINVEVGVAQGPPSDPQKISRLDKARRLAYHTRFLRQVAGSTPKIEVVWNMEEVLPSLLFIAENGSDKDNDAAKAVGSIFSRTEDSRALDLCLLALKRIGNKVAKKEMLRIYSDPTVPDEWRRACAEYLKLPPPSQAKWPQRLLESSEALPQTDETWG